MPNGEDSSGDDDPAAADSPDGSVRQINVGFRKDLDSIDQQAAEDALTTDLPSGATVVNRNRKLGYVTIELPGDTPASEKDAVKSSLQNRGDVRYAEDNEQDELYATPNDPEYGNQYAPQSVNAPAAWEHGYGDSSVVIGVSDQGVMYDHQDLSPNMDDTSYSAPDGASQSYDASNHGWDFGNDDNDPYPDDPPNQGHGTHVSGILGAASDNGLNIAGLSDCSILSLRTLNPGYQSDIADALMWATDQGVDVINMSHGGSDSTPKYDGVKYAHDAGVVLVAAAGNDGDTSDCDDNDCVGYPAAYSEVLAISNIDSNDNLASSSSTGPEIDLAAPGYFVLSTYTLSPSSTVTANGTSMATPVVSGIVGLMLSEDPTLTKSEVESILKSTAEDIGLADYEQGSGKVDAQAALEEVAASLDSLDLNWTQSVDGRVQFAEPVVANGKVYLGGLGQDFTAYDQGDGSTVWTQTRSGQLSDSSAALTGGRLWVGSGSGTLYAIDEDGTLAGEISFDSAITSSPVAADGRLIFGTNDGRVISRSSVDGNADWEVTIGSPVYSALDAANGVVFVTTPDGTLYALDETDGSTYWTESTGTDVGSSSPHVADGRVFFAADELYAFDAASTKDQQWSSGYGGAAGSSPATGGGNVYVGSADGGVYAFDVSSGSQQWSYGTGGAVEAGIAATDDRVVVPSSAGALYLLDSSGNPLATQSIPNDTKGTPVISAGTVYIGTRNGDVRSFG